jgi:hypothetical protein
LALLGRFSRRRKRREMQKVIAAYSYEIGITVHLKSLYWKKRLFDVLPEHLRMWLLSCM